MVDITSLWEPTLDIFSYIVITLALVFERILEKL